MSEEYGITPNKCHCIPFLLADGHTQDDLAMFWMVSRGTINHHAQRKCTCPSLDEPVSEGFISASDLAELREWTGWTCQQLARRLDTQESQVRRWLNGSERMDAEMAREVALLRADHRPTPAQQELTSPFAQEMEVGE